MFTEDKLSRESSLASNPQVQDVPEVSVDLVAPDDVEKLEPEKEEDVCTSLSIPKSTPETLSMNEKLEENEDINSIMASAEQQASDVLKSQSQAVLETCENVVSMKKNAIKKIVSEENEVESKVVVTNKK
ncbi:uncharacterized protein LOC124375046, partial [Homalodisca vitripennis]|uniref:uncharacterized protein LOC124375046 n=1 Tax=Homalodisca vitripennis TaxID=197043 RepID=UPI001EEA72D5